MKRIFTLLLSLCVLLLAGCGSDKSLNPDKPVSVTIWHVYGNQTNSPFNDLIDKFNASEGKKQGVIVKVESVSSSNVIDKALYASAKGAPGSAPLPNMFTAYPRVIDNLEDKLLDWNDYLTQDDLKIYKPEFLAEGYKGKKLYMLPIAKSTELFFLNQTFFDRFAAENNINPADLGDYDKLFAICRQYYK